MAYGTPQDVAEVASVWTSNRQWIDPAEGVRGTNPSLATVTEWLERVSAQMDLALGGHWFVTPIDVNDSPTAYAAVTQYVVKLVADMCHVANNVERETTPEGKIMKDMAAWVETQADGFLLDGVLQTQAVAEKKQVQFRMIGSV